MRLACSRDLDYRERRLEVANQFQMSVAEVGRMSEPSPQDCRMLYADAISELESTLLGSRIEEAEMAIQEHLRVMVETLSRRKRANFTRLFGNLGE